VQTEILVDARRKKTTFTIQKLPSLQPSLRLAQEMGEKLGSNHLL